MDPRFTQAEANYAALASDLTRGLLTQEQFQARLWEIMVRDDQGRYWSMGGGSGQWYVYENEQWTRADPPAAPTATTPAALTKSRPKRDRAPARRVASGDFEWAEAAWRWFSAPDGAFSVLMPGDPEEQREQKPLPSVTYRARCDAPIYGIFSVSYTGHDQAPQWGAATIEEMLAPAPHRLHRVTWQQPLTLQGYPGRDVVIESNTIKRRVRSYLIGRRLYSVQYFAVEDKAQPFAPDVDRFFESFRIDGEPPA